MLVEKVPSAIDLILVQLGYELQVYLRGLSGRLSLAIVRIPRLVQLLPSAELLALR